MSVRKEMESVKERLSSRKKSYEAKAYHHHRKWPIHSPRSPHYREDTYPREITHSMKLVEISIEDDETVGIRQDSSSSSSYSESEVLGKKASMKPVTAPVNDNLSKIQEEISVDSQSELKSPSCCSYGPLRDVSGSMPSIFEEMEDSTEPLHEATIHVSDGSQTFYAAEYGGRKVWVPTDDSDGGHDKQDSNEGTTIIYQSEKCINHPPKLNLGKAFGRVAFRKFRPTELPRVIIEKNENGVIKRQLIPGKYSCAARWLLYGTRVYEFMGHAFLQHRTNPTIVNCCVCIKTGTTTKKDYFRCRDCHFICYKLNTGEVKSVCPVSTTHSLEMTFPYDQENKEKKPT